MAHADDIDPYASLAEWLASDVRKYRVRAGMEQQDLAKHLRVSFQHMNNLEANRRKFTREHAKTLDRVFGTDEHFETLWVHSQREHDRDWFRQFTTYESRARSIKVFQALVVPGLLQTPDYTRALLEAGHANDIDTLIDARIARQEVLARDEPPLLWVLLDERALQAPVGGPAVMRAQLEKILQVAKLRHVTVQVVRVSEGEHVGLDGGFIIVSLGEEGDLAYVEAQLGGRLIQDEVEVKILDVRYDRIRAKALSEADSLELITSMMERFK